MRAMELTDPGPVAGGGRLTLVERPAPRPGRGEVLIDVAGVRGVPHRPAARARATSPPTGCRSCPATRSSGRIGGARCRASTRRPPRSGDRVGVAWIAGDLRHGAGSAPPAGRTCASGRTFTGWDRDGGYAEPGRRRGPTSSTPCPDGFDDLAAAPLLCGA